MVTLSLVFHGALVVVAFVHSFWHIEELSPPNVTVTFLSATPPPPPPPPPPKRKSAPKSKPTPQKTLAQPRPNELMQPRDKPVDKPVEDTGEEGGMEGGVEGGVSGSPIAAAPPPPPPPPKKEDPPRVLPPSIAGQQLLTNPVTDPQYRVVMPPAFGQAGMRLWAMVKICVSTQGNVSDVKVIKGMDPAVDGLLVDKIKTWKYKPVTIDGKFVTFCYNLRYEHVPR